MQKHYTIFNDPVHGVVPIPGGLVSELVDHPIFQRLRRIKQIGLGFMVFPGGEHSRFGHALGAFFLMNKILGKLRQKGVDISDEELLAAGIAILLHDVGHGPFSHALEGVLIRDFRHEDMSVALFETLNKEFNGQLDLALQMFKGEYSRPFFYQLISSQLDADRLDYLTRDSFFTGVREGGIGLERLLETMIVQNEQIVIQQKGIYALENYIMARNLMYKQVYLHKTNLAADSMLHQLFLRMTDLIHLDEVKRALSPALLYFLENKPMGGFGLSDELITQYLKLDDFDIWQCVKMLSSHSDPVLSYFSNALLNRRLFKIKAVDDLNSVDLDILKQATSKALKDLFPSTPSEDILTYFYDLQEVRVEAYQGGSGKIRILMQNGELKEFSEAADTEHIRSLMKAVRKNYVMHLPQVTKAFTSHQGDLYK